MPYRHIPLIQWFTNSCVVLISVVNIIYCQQTEEFIKHRTVEIDKTHIEVEQTDQFASKYQNIRAIRDELRWMKSMFTDIYNVTSSTYKIDRKNRQKFYSHS